jgi:hypothetical protein
MLLFLLFLLLLLLLMHLLLLLPLLLLLLLLLLLFRWPYSPMRTSASLMDFSQSRLFSDLTQLHHLFLSRPLRIIVQYSTYFLLLSILLTQLLFRYSALPGWFV